MRLSIATAYWPIIWPAPFAATLTIRTGSSTLEVPVRHDTGDTAELTFAPPASGPFAPTTQVDPGTIRRYSLQDHVSGETTYVTEGVGGLFGEGILRFDEIGTQLCHSLKRELTIRDDDPLSARYVLTQSYEMGRDGWKILVETQTRMHADRDNFYLSGTLVAYENGRACTKREWKETIARDLV